MNTEIRLSIDDGPERIMEMGRELSLDEKAWLTAFLCGVIRSAQVWLESGCVRRPTSDDSGEIDIRAGVRVDR